MNNLRKPAAVVLIASMLLGVCSCSTSKIDTSIIDSANRLASAIKSRDYAKVEELSSTGDDELSSIFSSCSTGSKDLIASSIEYEVDSDSFSGGLKGGNVDIIFSYIDYKSVTEDVLFIDPSAVDSAISSCSSRVEVTLNFEFTKSKDIVLCTNVSVAEELFPYAYEEFSVAEPLETYAGDITVSDASFTGGEYVFSTAPSSVSGSLAIEGDGQLLTWETYWIVEDANGGFVEAGDTVVTECPSELTFDCPFSYDLFPNGEYTVSFYLADYTLIASVPFRMEYEESEYTASADGQGYVVTSHGATIAFPDTDLQIDLPPDIQCVDPEVYLSELDESELLNNPVLFLSGSVTEYSSIYCFYLDFDSYDSPEARDYLSVLLSEYSSCPISYGTCTVGDHEFPVAYVTIDYGSMVLYVSYTLVGDEDSCYVLVTGSSDGGFADEVLGRISVV